MLLFIKNKIKSYIFTDIFCKWKRPHYIKMSYQSTVTLLLFLVCIFGVSTDAQCPVNYCGVNGNCVALGTSCKYFTLNFKWSQLLIEF